ncbi:MAG TPA: hypothetical protein VHX38_02720 [Pseudonocardiaceae bacterium]|nr:hypothetical protein [Pseudonocardiaceae bacterium]
MSRSETAAGASNTPGDAPAAPRDMPCSECPDLIRKGKPMMPSGLDGTREQLYAHPACWHRTYDAI